MKYILGFLLIYFVTLPITKAQDDPYRPGESDKVLRDFRAKITTPPYGLSKVKGLISKTTYKAAEYNDTGIQALETADYKKLTLREKFTYTMIHPEVSAQNCAIFMPQPDEDKKIFSYLISWTDESSWSERQVNFMRENRDSVMSLIKESTARSGHMGVNYKDALGLLNAWEMIPFLINYFNGNKKDKDALTLMLLLMKKGEFEPFMKSTSYSKLYGSDYSYESYINYNKANEDLIINRAQSYYEEKK